MILKWKLRVLPYLRFFNRHFRRKPHQVYVEYIECFPCLRTRSFSNRIRKRFRRVDWYGSFSNQYWLVNALWECFMFNNCDLGKQSFIRSTLISVPPVLDLALRALHISGIKCFLLRPPAFGEPWMYWVNYCQYFAHYDWR